jgi:hypothetical protein
MNCSDHGKPLDIVCIKDRALLCAHCAIFGGHPNHSFRTVEEFEAEVGAMTRGYGQLKLGSEVKWT